jgi:hypothetical protein
MLTLILDHLAGLLKQLKKELLQEILTAIRNSEATLRMENYELRQRLRVIEKLLSAAGKH